MRVIRLGGQCRIRQKKDAKMHCGLPGEGITLTDRDLIRIGRQQRIIARSLKVKLYIKSATN